MMSPTPNEHGNVCTLYIPHSTASITEGSTRFCTGVGARGFTPNGVSPAFGKAGGGVSMSTDKATWEEGHEVERGAGSRSHFLGRVSAGVAAAVAAGAVVEGSGLAVAPAFADR